jgi:hypothetical protein
MTNSITMTWTNQTDLTMNFHIVGWKHGEQPTASPISMSANQTLSNVVAVQSNNLSPGPEGTYTWVDTGGGTLASIDYIHPAGHGTTYVTVSCSPGLEISSDGKNYQPSHKFNDPSLQHENATISLFLKAK